MAKNVLIMGYGPGVSNAFCEKFGKEGEFTFALGSLDLKQATDGVDSLAKVGVTAHAFQFEAAEPDSIKAMVAAAKEKLGGPIDVMLWNPPAGAPIPDPKYGKAKVGGDLVTCPLEEYDYCMDVMVRGFIATMQLIVEDLKQTKGAVFITQAAIVEHNDALNNILANVMACSSHAVGKTALYKAAGIIGMQLKKDGVFLGQVAPLDRVKKSQMDFAEGVGPGPAIVPAEYVGNAFWHLYKNRDDEDNRIDRALQVTKEGFEGMVERKRATVTGRKSLRTVFSEPVPDFFEEDHDEA